jgi:cytoskeletal protein CcmA (bactofilin family)
MKLRDKIETVIGKDTAIEGNLRFSGAIRIDGCFKGRIHSGGTLIVGRDGRVESDIHVGNIIVAGQVQGNILAEKSIEIQVPGRVFGDIQAPKVTIHPGVVFEGTCRTAAVPKDPALKLALIQSQTDDCADRLRRGADTGSYS